MVAVPDEHDIPRRLNDPVLLGSVAHGEVARILGNARVGIDVHPWAQPHLQPALERALKHKGVLRA